MDREMEKRRERKRDSEREQREQREIERVCMCVCMYVCLFEKGDFEMKITFVILPLIFYVPLYKKVQELGKK